MQIKWMKKGPGENPVNYCKMPLFLVFLGAFKLNVLATISLERTREQLSWAALLMPAVAERESGKTHF